MKEFKYTEELISDCSSISSNPEEILFFDIETTGLSHQHSDLYIIGYGSFHNNVYNIHLLFNDDGASEHDILLEFVNKLKHFRYLVSYNGDTFDIPYIRTRLKLYGISDPFDSLISVDVYKTTRKFKKIFKLPSTRQIDIEDLVGFHRQNFISGGDLIAAYKQYLHNRSQKLLESMLIHNLDDIKGLISISGCLNLPHINECTVSNIAATDTDITYTCSIPYIPCRVTYADSHIRINAYQQSMSVKVGIVHAVMKYFFKDYKNYYYLPVEGVAIHKSMAEFVDAEHKEKATKLTAFTTRESDFVYSEPLPDMKIFYDTDFKGDHFIEVSPCILSPGTTADAYVSRLISIILPR